MVDLAPVEAKVVVVEGGPNKPSTPVMSYSVNVEVVGLLDKTVNFLMGMALPWEERLLS